MTSRPTIDLAHPWEWHEAAELLFSVFPETSRKKRIDRLLTLLGQPFQTEPFLFVARGDSGILGAAFLQLQPGRSAIVFPPGGTSNIEVEDALADAMVAQLRETSTLYAQCLLHPEHAFRARPLERSGFRFITHLLDFTRRPDAEIPVHFDPDLDLERLDEPTSTFAETLLKTYEDGLDFPELNSTRTAEEILDGYRSSALPEQFEWWLLRSDGEPVGVLVLVNHGEMEPLELFYLGIVPSARQRGLGRALLRLAIDRSNLLSKRGLELGVDLRNQPAIDMYQSMGFVTTAVHHVYLWLPAITSEHVKIP